MGKCIDSRHCCSSSVPCPVMCARNPEGFWEYQLEGCDPVKLFVKPLDPFNWIVTCRIPQGNEMESKLEKVADGNFSLVEFNCSNNETAKNGEVEAEFKAYLEKGITGLVSTGKILSVTAGGVEKHFTLKKEEEAEEAKLDLGLIKSPDLAGLTMSPDFEL